MTNSTEDFTTDRQPVLCPSVTIVIPAYNEQDSIGDVIRQLRAGLANRPHEILVVDDGSTDRTAEIAQDESAIVISHGTNRGYGAALKTGFHTAEHDLVGIVDADGTYPIERFSDLLDGADSWDMIVGARLSGKVHVPLIRRPAKWFLNMLANFMAGTKIPDLNSGMRVIRRSVVLDFLGILPDRFSFTTTITLASLCDGYRVKFVPIEYHRRIGRSKIKATDAFNFLVLIIRTMIYFRPLRVFLPLSLLLFGGAAVKLSIDIFLFDNVEDTSVILFLSGLQTLFVGMLADLMCFVRRGMKTSRR